MKVLTIEIDDKHQKELAKIVENLKGRFAENPWEKGKKEIDEVTAIKVAISEYYKKVRQ